MAEQNVKRDRIVGILLMSLSAIAFSMMNSITKYANNIGYSSSQTGIARGIIQIIIFPIIMIFNEEFNFNFLEKGKEKSIIIYLILIGVCEALITFCIFKAMTLINYSDACALSNISPIITTIFAYFILKEPIFNSQIISLILIIGGAFLITQPSMIFGGNNIGNFVGYIFAIFASIFNAFSQIIARKLKNIPANVVVLSFSIILVITGIFSAFTLEYFYINPNFNYVDVLLLISIGLFGGISIKAFQMSMQKLEAGIASVINSTSILYSYLFSWILFNQTGNIYTLFGVVLIIIGITCLSMVNYCSNKDNEPIRYDATNTSDSFDTITVTDITPQYIHA